MIPAASSRKNLLCARPCRNMASLVLTSPDEALTIIQVEHLKLKKFTHSSVAGTSPQSGPPLPPCTAWPRPGKTFGRPPGLWGKRPRALHTKDNSGAAEEENRSSVDSVPGSAAEGVGRTRGEKPSGPLPHSSRPPFRPPKLNEHGGGEKNGEQKEGEEASGQLAFVTQPCSWSRGREGVSWKKLTHSDKLASENTAADGGGLGGRGGSRFKPQGGPNPRPTMSGCGSLAQCLSFITCKMG